MRELELRVNAKGSTLWITEDWCGGIHKETIRGLKEIISYLIKCRRTDKDNQDVYNQFLDDCYNEQYKGL